jgi:riboflavin transporter FmnP
VKIAILSALATGIMLLEFPLAVIAPPFYKLDLSEAVILIGGFALGPLPALIIEFVKKRLIIEQLEE